MQNKSDNMVSVSEFTRCASNVRPLHQCML